MATSFKSVPWFDVGEWRNVYELLFSPNSDSVNKRRALQILLVWKARCPVLPSAIESTLGFLEVELNLPTQEKDQIKSDRITRLMYSSVIMRFINHALDDAPYKGQTLLQAASIMNIPEWIVNLRHETAHGHELPSLSLLKNAAFYAMNWLFDTYWVPQNDVIENFTTQRYITDDLEQDLTLLINNYNLLTIFSSARFNFNTFNDIPDEDIKQSLFDFISDRIVKSKVGTHWDMSVKHVSQKVLKEINQALIHSKNENKDLYVSKILIDNESLFMASDIDFAETENKFDELPVWFVSAFEPLLALVHRRSLISTLMKELLRVTSDEGESSERRTRAAQWIREISLGLYKSKLFASIADKYTMEKKNKKSKEKEIQLRLLTHHYPNQKSGLTLDLLSPVPEALSDKKIIYENLSKPNQYMKIYIKEFLSLNETLDKLSIEQIIDLVNVVSPDVKKSADLANNNVRTITDLAKECGDEMEVDIYSKEMQQDTTANEVFTSSKWDRASHDFDWKNCPLGILPWQLSKIVNPSLPHEVRV